MNVKLNVTYWKSLLFIMSSFHYRCLKVELSKRNLVRVCIPNSYDFGDQSRTRLVDECLTSDLAKGNDSYSCFNPCIIAVPYQGTLNVLFSLDRIFALTLAFAQVTPSRHKKQMNLFCSALDFS